MMGSVKGMFGFGDETDNQAEIDLDELRERIERLRSVLRDPTRTDFRVVMIPEEMSVVESERLITRLEEYEIPVQTLIINRVMEDLVDVTEFDTDGCLRIQQIVRSVNDGGMCNRQQFSVRLISSVDEK
jgi:arsenite-transporting ATPase